MALGFKDLSKLRRHKNLKRKITSHENKINANRKSNCAITTQPNHDKTQNNEDQRNLGSSNGQSGIRDELGKNFPTLNYEPCFS